MHVTDTFVIKMVHLCNGSSVTFKAKLISSMHDKDNYVWVVDEHCVYVHVL